MMVPLRNLSSFGLSTDERCRGLMRVLSPKAVVFDLGGVLVEVDSTKALRDLRAHCTAGAGFTPDLPGTQRLVRAFECGELATQGFYEAVCRQEALSVDLERFCEAYCDIFSPVEEMIDAHAALRRAGVATYLFSNTSELHFNRIRERYPFMAGFAGYFLSYELGCMKPDARAYVAVEDATGCRPGELVFIDDRPENVEGAARRGWRAIRHTHPRLTVAALKDLGLL